MPTKFSETGDMSALEQLGRYVAESDPPANELCEMLELHLIDTVGALIASTRTPEGLRLLRFRAEMRENSGDALALDLSTRCALARLSEIDDIHLPSMTTPGAIVIPGALTLAAAMPAVTMQDVTLNDIAMRDVLAAIIAGYEAMTRLGRALDGPAILYRGIWPTYFAAPFGIAAVAARLFKLDAKRSANALALALTLAAPGVGHHNAESNSRWLAIGAAAGNGLTAARAAKMGFTSDRKLTESNFFPGVYGIALDAPALTHALGGRSALAEVSFKPWCAARQTMAATQALNEIIESGVRPQDMDRIEVFVLPPHLKMIDHGTTSGDRASHLTSVHYCMAVAALAESTAADVGQTPREVSRPVRELMNKIKVTPDESLLADYPRRWPARVIATAGSARCERLVTDVPGDPARAFDRARVEEKFIRFVAPVLGRDKTGQLLARCGDALAGGRFAALVSEIEAACRDALARPTLC
jgi:2-methylcitrate dehydratase PrpD